MVSVFYCICVALVFALRGAREYFARYLKVFSVTLLIFVGSNLCFQVYEDVRDYFDGLNASPATAVKVPYKNSDAGSYPDIYYIILDSYSGEKALKEYFGFDNSSFIRWLKSRGFTVPENPWSNYCQTALSIPSSLNMDYIDSLVNIKPLHDSGTRGPLQKLMADNALSVFLKTRGYTVVKFFYGYSVTDAFRADITDEPQGSFFFHEFANHVANTTMLAAFRYFFESVVTMSANIRRIMSMLEGLPVATVKFKSPKFVFAHIICPHPPFDFDRNGPILKRGGPDSSHDDEPGYDFKKSEYKKGYLGNVEFLNIHIKSAIDKILKNSKTQPIIILQADHGSGLSYFPDVNKTNVADRFSILNAYYLPNGGGRIVYPGITPVNTFRGILDYYFGTKLGRLPDLSYFAAYERPYIFYDVTGRLKAAE